MFLHTAEDESTQKETCLSPHFPPSIGPRLSWLRTVFSAASYQQLTQFLSEYIRFIQSFATLCYTAATSCCVLCLYFHTSIRCTTSWTPAYTALSSHEGSKCDCYHCPTSQHKRRPWHAERGTYSSRPVRIGGRRPKHIIPVGYLTNCFSGLLNIVVSRHRIPSTRKKGQRSCLGACEKLRNATISFVTSVSPSVRMEQLDSHWTEFNEIWYLSIYLKSVEKIQILLKTQKNSGYFTCWPIYIFWSNLAQFFLQWEIFPSKLVEKIEARIHVQLLFPPKIVPFMI